MSPKTAAQLFATGLALFLVSCATKTFDQSNAPHYAVAAKFAAFYRFGPMQPGGPDLSLRSGDRLRLLRREMGYSFVKIPDGRSGYVANEAIRPAPAPSPAPAPKKRAAPKPAPSPQSIPVPAAGGPFPEFRF